MEVLQIFGFWDKEIDLWFTNYKPLIPTLIQNPLLQYSCTYIIHIIRVIIYHNTVILGIWMMYIIYQPLVLALVGETPFIMFLFCLIIF